MHYQTNMTSSYPQQHFPKVMFIFPKVPETVPWRTEEIHAGEGVAITRADGYSAGDDRGPLTPQCFKGPSERSFFLFKQFFFTDPFSGKPT